VVGVVLVSIKYMLMLSTNFPFIATILSLFFFLSVVYPKSFFLFLTAAPVVVGDLGFGVV